MYFTKGIFAILMSLATVDAFAQTKDSWSSRQLRSREGVEITVDYKFSKCLYLQKGGHIIEIRTAAPVWMNVRGIGPQQQVQADVIFFEQSYISYGGSNPIKRSYDHYDRTISLSYTENGRYTAEAGTLAVRYNDGAAHVGLNILQGLRIRINGKALIDPISNSEWFLVKLDDGKGC